MIGPFKTVLARPRLSSSIRAFSRLRCVLVPIAVAAVARMVAWVSFGLIFNYTHSVPSGSTGKLPISEYPRNPAPYVFFCPDVRWPSMKGQPNYRDPMRTCPDGFFTAHQACRCMAR